ncbi:monocarboxylate transporter 12-like [Amphiura filiformis]|uniref:monocarboxylate transporter 12-like n=1 Tax=Amphiura filiformis TaxID=82378 RepID=UPI003B21586F
MVMKVHTFIAIKYSSQLYRDNNYYSLCFETLVRQKRQKMNFISRLLSSSLAFLSGLASLGQYRAFLLLSVMFTINFLHGGTVKSLGVYLQYIKLELKNSTATALGFAFGVPSALTYIMAPIAIYLSRRFGFRLCMMSGALLLTIGWSVTSFFGTTVFYILVSFTIVGLGAGFLVVPSNVAIVPHFNKNLAFANSIGNSGQVLGIMIMPPLAEFLNDIYGWRGSILILSGLVFHICAIVALLRPTVFNISKYDAATKSNYENIPESKFKHVILSEENDISERSELLHNENKNQYGPALVKIHVAIFALLGLSVLTWAVFLVPHAVDSGIPMKWAVYLSSAGGIGGLIGQIHLGPIVDRKWMTSSQVYLYMTILNILAIVCDYLIPMYSIKLLAAFIGGFTLLGRGALRVPMAAEIRESLDTVLSYSFFFYGVACLPGTTLAGWIHDVTGSYQHSILFIGFVEFISSMLVITSMVLSAHVKKQENWTTPE